MGDPGKSASCDVLIFKVVIDTETTQDPECCEEIQVQRVNTSSFEWEAIPFKIVYDILPASGWNPDEVKLSILDLSDNVVFSTTSLPTSPGNNKTYNWDGKNNAGELVIYGYYSVKIRVKKNNSTMETPKYQFTVYQINLGNTVYYDLDVPNEHAGVIYYYIGGNKINDLQNMNKYLICEVQGPGSTVGVSRTLQEFIAYSTFRGIHTSLYLPSNIFAERRERAQIIKNCFQMIGIPYMDFPYLDVLIPNGSWDGVISDIQRIRCDGVPEVAYENSATRLYCTDTNWNIMLSQENLDYHNSNCTPRAQRLSQQPRSLYSP